MKKLLLLSFLLSRCLCSIADHTVIEQLMKVNSQWAVQPCRASFIDETMDKTGNKSFNEWIAIHLMLVEQTLREKDISNLNSNQRSNRLRLLNELNGYWRQGIFPVNDYLAYKNPVFIDRKGTHCAVGYLMQQSGSEGLARKIAAGEKFAYVHEIKTEGVAAWAAENGFTPDELAWIQPGYPPSFTAHDLEGGLNGTVNAMVVDPVQNMLYAGGAFTANADGFSCNHIAVYISGFAGWDWIPLGEGLNGTVHAMLLHNNQIYVGGDFTASDTMLLNHIAVYDIQSGQWQAMGGLDSAVKALAVFNNEVYAGGRFTGMVAKWTGSQWQDVSNGLIYGEEVRTMEPWGNQLLVGGNFELATGAPRRHVAAYDGVYMGASGMGTLTPVNDFELFNGKMYAGCDYVYGTDTCALAVFENVNFDWMPILNSGFGDPFITYFQGTIKNLLADGSRLLSAGNFMCGGGLYHGNNLMMYMESLTDTSTIPLLSIDSTINDITFFNNMLCFSGEFINTYSWGTPADTLNHIGLLEMTPTKVKELIPGNSLFKIYPNPAKDFLNLVISGDKPDGIIVYDITGKMVIQRPVNTFSAQLSLQGLAPGLYSIQAMRGNKSEIARFVKE